MYVIASMALIIPFTLAIWFAWDSEQINVVPRLLAPICLIFGVTAAESVLFLLFIAVVIFGVVRIALLTQRINNLEIREHRRTNSRGYST
jgi:hypothetical protein